MKYVIEFLKYIGVLLLYFLLNFIGVFVAMFLLAFKTMYAEFPNINTRPEAIAEILEQILLSQSYITMSLAVASFILIMTMLMFQCITGKGPFNNFKFDISVPRYLLYGMGFNFIISLLSVVVLPTEYIESTNQTSAVLFEGNPIFIVATTAFLVPVFEEIVFRYLFLKNKFPYMIKAKKLGIPVEDILDDKTCFIIAAVIQALLFGLMHGEPFQMIYTFCLGFMFACIDKKSDSLLPSICMHCGLNLYASLGVCFEESAIILAGIGFIGAIIIVIDLFCRRFL